MNMHAGTPSLIPGAIRLHGKKAFFNRLTTASAVGIPALATLSALVLSATGHLHFGWADFFIGAFMYTLTGLGVTVGLHRFFTHRSFEATPGLQAILGVAGIMALQGDITGWAATHRRHHRYSDQHGDPHSPAGTGRKNWGTLRTLFHVHFGRLFLAEDTLAEVYAPDLCQNSLVQKIDRLALLWIFMTLAIPAALGWILIGGLSGAASGMLWGGPVRIFIGQNIGSCVNSLCHMFGQSPFKTNDSSKNNLFVGIAAFGEGWHNNHHAFPNSARQGLLWWQLDLSYLLIVFFRFSGLAHGVKTPAESLIAEKKLQTLPEALQPLVS